MSCGRFYNTKCLIKGVYKTTQIVLHLTRGPSRQHCGPAHPTSGGAGNTRKRSNILRSNISRIRRAGSRSSDLNYERYRNQESTRRCTIETPRGSTFPLRDSPS
ncbi:hypothetical protein EVAR_92144_1 [Eumeta japonica]|uniref:Uncharacterized protein n=1 Tax=Eumeta variegata TaxID=151549 RepID=A0A4C1T1X2_EUMVA|nr:hypothetical protein EVAR_92144_1 [Eumeta japonica]